MKGDLVIVRSAGDEPRLLRVWAVTPDVVLVSAPEQFARLQSGLDALAPVGFPKSEVYRYDAALDREVQSGKVDWGALARYHQ